MNVMDNGFGKSKMYGPFLAATVAIYGSSPSDNSWEIPCERPLDLLIRELRTPQPPKLPVPGTSRSYQAPKRAWVSLSLMPDIVSFDEPDWRPGRSFSFSVDNSSNSFKAQLLRRFGLMEVRSRGFGATLRFASAPNWAFQFKGRKRLTIAYVTKF